MKVSTLLVRARGTALVPSLEHLSANPRVFIGREWCVVDGLAALKPSDEPVSIPARAEYVRAVKEGSLTAADEDTAKACGVEFELDLGVEGDTQ